MLWPAPDVNRTHDHSNRAFHVLPFSDLYLLIYLIAITVSRFRDLAASTIYSLLLTEATNKQTNPEHNIVGVGT